MYNDDYLDEKYDADKSDWEDGFIKENSPDFCHKCEKIYCSHSIVGTECVCSMTEENPPDYINECPLLIELV